MLAPNKNPHQQIRKLKLLVNSLPGENCSRRHYNSFPAWAGNELLEEIEISRRMYASARHSEAKALAEGDVDLAAFWRSVRLTASCELRAHEKQLSLERFKAQGIDPPQDEEKQPIWKFIDS